MDSMRSLNTSLPRTAPRGQAQQAPEDILSAFKAAALSVTTLYRAAASDQARSRAAGYQDALDDLLTFLDKENLGLGDGEGWRVRRWATERLDGSNTGKAEDDEDEEEAAQEEERPSATQVSETHKEASVESHTETPPPRHQPRQQEQQPESSPVLPHTATFQHSTSHQPPTSSFVFRSAHQYPTNHDREVPMDVMSDASEPQTHTTQSDNAVRIEPPPRSHRNRPNRTPSNRPSGNRTTLGTGAGSKRKIPFGDFFDLGGLSFDQNNNNNNGNNNGNDRGGKRGRHV